MWVIGPSDDDARKFCCHFSNNIKRMLAYSSIAHAGYILVAFVAEMTWNFGISSISWPMLL